MQVHYHPLFEHWLTELATGDDEIFGEVMALLVALEQHGRALDDETRDESHPIVKRGAGGRPRTRAVACGAGA